ncbi:MAG: fumarylacetoacetate hydrolase family protein [Caldilineaceae bacterium]|nr:fumarylacetoacetate hydrolase family protein [Caldilineaceae bacterium]MDE0461623.1 fumarylacetoacetate hydrolase family protein [Caldilineaceae bacterium]
MKMLRYSANDEIRFGILEEDGTVRQMTSCPWDSMEESGETTHLDNVRVLAPIGKPRLIGVGLNYLAHAEEGGQTPPDQPMLFMLPSTAILDPEEAIVYPKQGQNVHYEGELTVIMGKKARRVSEAEALDYVLGYTCGNDVSERVIQANEMANGCMLIGKGFDTFKPIGPYIATGLDSTNLELTTRLNGEVKQHTNTDDLIFSVAQLIAYISEAITLLPGDVIMTGTPSGVGPVQPGDVVEIEISGVGVLRNPVVAEG